MDLLNAAKEAISEAVDDVKEAVKDTGVSAMTKVAENELKERLGYEIEVDAEDIPDNWKEWIMKTGVNSLLNDSTWDFLEDSESNKLKVDLWKERDIKKIILAVNTECDDDDNWIVARVDWETDAKEFKIVFHPRAKQWQSNNSWIEPGHKSWWILRDEIVFGLQLYQLPGRCFYKSDYLDGFEDPDPDSSSPFGKKKFKRWFQFRHWVMFWYGKARWGWNYQWTKTPPPNPDGSIFTLDSVLSMPSMPDLSMPEISLPELPDVEMPSLPDVEMPSVSAPSVSAPSIDLSNVSAPSMPDKPTRPTSKWAAHGIVELKGLNIKAKGKTLIFSDATLTHFWQDGPHHVKNEKKEHQRLELDATSAEQAQSWVDTLKESGVKEGEVGGCCTIA